MPKANYTDLAKNSCLYWPHTVPFCLECGCLANTQRYSMKGLCLPCALAMDREDLIAHRKLADRGRHTKHWGLARLLRHIGLRAATEALSATKEEVLGWAKGDEPEEVRVMVDKLWGEYSADVQVREKRWRKLVDTGAIDMKVELQPIDQYVGVCNRGIWNE